MQSLQSYRISPKLGMVIEEPMRTLPLKYEPWQEFLTHLRDYLLEKSVERRVEMLPLLNVDDLLSHKELCIAHLQLAIIASAYVWGRGLKSPSTILPECVAVPLYQISCRLGLPPILTYADLFCANIYVSKNDWKTKEMELGLLYKFSNSRHWESFCSTVAMTEIRFAETIPHIVKAAEASQRFGNRKDRKEMMEELRLVLQGIRKLKTGITTLSGSLSPEYFFYHIQPFLTGWNSEIPTLKSGLIYEGISNEPLSCPSASVTQSPILPICDALLGIQPDEKESNLQGMISEHRRFIDDLSRISRVKQIVIEKEDRILSDLYIRLVAAVDVFRTEHSNLFIRSMNTRHGRELII